MDTIYVNTSKTIWDSLPVWLSAIGTLSAVIASLYFSRKSDRIKGKIKLTQNIRFDGVSSEVIISIRITNVWRRSFIVTGLGFQYGLLRKKYWQVVSFPSEYFDKIPITLNDGEEANYSFPEKSYIIDHVTLTKKRIKHFTRLSPYFIKYYFNTSHGMVFKTRLPKEIREYFKKES